jgi:hypothetical protein
LGLSVPGFNISVPDVSTFVHRTILCCTKYDVLSYGGALKPVGHWKEHSWDLTPNSR